MTPSRLTSSVMVAGGVLAAAVALLATLLGGLHAGAGVVAGAALALGNFHWLAADTVAVCEAVEGRRRRTWLPWAGLRFAALVTAAAVVFLGGWGHPAGVAAGVSVVPFALVAAGLHGLRREARG